MNYFLAYLLVFAALALTGSCGNNDENHKSIRPYAATAGSELQQAQYDPDKVVTCKMKNKLREISGIHYVKDDLFAAIQDESGKIFTVNFTNGDIVQERHFAGNGDYEDITLDHGFYYVLESSGTIYKVPREGDPAQTTSFSFPQKNHQEFESLYLDQSGEKLVMICKNCPGKKNNFKKYAYAFDIKTATFSEEPLFTIDMGTLPGRLPNTGPDLKPSAAAVHPIEKKLYVLCSVGKMLLVCDLQGKIEKSWPLNPQIYQQPEGIAFNAGGDLFISNEAVDGKGNIVKVAYRK